MQGINADQIKPGIPAPDTGNPQALSDDVEGRPGAIDSTGACVRDLPLPNVAVQVADGYLERFGPRMSLPALHTHPVRADIESVTVVSFVADRIFALWHIGRDILAITNKGPGLGLSDRPEY